MKLIKRMVISEVRTKNQKRDFLKVPRIIYKNDPNWVSHLDQDIEAIFDPEKNKFFDFGIAARWVLYDENHNLLGRVAAFINRHLAYTYEHPTGGMGFFECVNDQKAAHLLFDTVKNWLEKRGMQAMDGPINFGEKDRYWGLLTDGFNTPPPYLLNYNPPWYQELFESYGFQDYYQQYVYGLNSDTEVHPIVLRAFDRLKRDKGYRFESAQIKNMGKYATDFSTIYNEAWRDVHKHFKPISPEQAFGMFKSMQQILDEDLMIFGYHNDRPIAMFVGIPELNQIFRHVDGNLNWRGKLKFLYHKWRGACTTVYGLVFGVVPDYRNKGIESGLIIAIKMSILKTNRYNEMYLSWIGDFNPKMIRIAEILSKRKVFTLITYRKMFKKEYTFARHEVID